MDDLIALLYLAVVAPDSPSSLSEAFPRRFEAGLAPSFATDGLSGQLVEAALDLISHPAFVTDVHARIRHGNRAGRAERSMIDRGGLSLNDRHDAQRLRRAIADVAKGGPGGTILAEGSVITAGPLPGSFAPLADVSGLVLVVVQPLLEDSGVLSRRCVQALGLTPAEADVVARVAAGESPTEVAAGRGVGVATVRTLIRRALDKTGCAGLRELTGLVLRLPSGFS